MDSGLQPGQIPHAGRSHQATRFFLDCLHSCSLASSFIRSCLCLCIDAFLGTTQTHIILSPVALLHV